MGRLTHPCTSRERVEIASWTPYGPVSVRAVHVGDTLSVFAWGDGADYAVESADGWLGLNDQPEAFSHSRTGPRFAQTL